MNVEINLIDLLFYVLRRWKKIVIAALIFSLLLGCASAILTVKKNIALDKSADMESYKGSVAVYEDSYALFEREIEILREKIADQQAYLEKSVMLNMDAKNFYAAVLMFFAETENEEALTIFTNMLRSTDILECAAKELGWEVDCLGELISFECLMEEGDCTGIYTVRGNVPTQEDAEKLLNCFEKKVGQLGDKMNANGLKYHDTVFLKKVNNTSSNSIETRQRGEKDVLTNLQSELVHKEKELQELTRPVMPGEIRKASVVIAFLKSGIMGAVICLVLMMALFAIQFVHGGKVYSTEEFVKNTSLRLMGRYNASSEETYGRIDLLIRKIEGNKQVDDWEKELDLVAANIRSYGQQMQSILFTGTVAEDDIQSLVDMLKNRNIGKNIVAGGNLLTDANTVDKLKDFDGAILVEQIGVSGYREIQTEIQKIEDLNMKLVGTVLIQ